jgi:hypothetical protein
VQPLLLNGQNWRWAGQDGLTRGGGGGCTQADIEQLFAKKVVETKVAVEAPKKPEVVQLLDPRRENNCGIQLSCARPRALRRHPHPRRPSSAPTPSLSVSSVRLSGRWLV